MRVPFDLLTISLSQESSPNRYRCISVEALLFTCYERVSRSRPARELILSFFLLAVLEENCGSRFS